MYTLLTEPTCIEVLKGKQDTTSASVKLVLGTMGVKYYAMKDIKKITEPGRHTTSVNMVMMEIAYAFTTTICEILKKQKVKCNTGLICQSMYKQVNDFNYKPKDMFNSEWFSRKRMTILLCLIMIKTISKIAEQTNIEAQGIYNALLGEYAAQTFSILSNEISIIRGLLTEKSLPAKLITMFTLELMILYNGFQSPVETISGTGSEMTLDKHIKDLGYGEFVAETEQKDILMDFFTKNNADELQLFLSDELIEFSQETEIEIFDMIEHGNELFDKLNNENGNGNEKEYGQTALIKEEELERTNHRIKIEPKMKMSIDDNVVKIVRKCLEKTGKRIEISIFVPYKVNGLEIEVMDIDGDRKYIIPKQENSAAAVNYIDDSTKIPDMYAIIHTHPGGGSTSFSTTDRRTINENQDLSILFNSDAQLCDLSYQVKLSDSDYLLLDKNAFVINVTSEIQVDGIENIKEKTYTYETKYSELYKDSYKKTLATNNRDSYDGLSGFFQE